MIILRGQKNTMRATARNALRTYRREVSRTRESGHGTEHSYRSDLGTLINTLGDGGVRAINEPTHVDCGAPDFIVHNDGVPIGHIECKDIGTSLDRVEDSEQLQRYRAGLPNLILTDYLEFRWYVDGERRQTAYAGRIKPTGKIAGKKESDEAVTQLLDAFLFADPQPVASARELARQMAAKARLLRDGIERILGKEGRSGLLGELLVAYRNVLIADLSEEAFADLQAQTAAYGLFAARCLQQGGSQPFTRQSAVFAETTPFLRDVFGRIAGPGIDPQIAWIVDDLALLLERTEMEQVLADFGRRTRGEDPVVHFYEDFLEAYDPALREVRGVYYTPWPIVSYIVHSIDKLLRDHFDLPDGLATTEAAQGEGRPVVILDPAAGTGAFLRETIAQIRNTLESKGLGGAWPDYVRDHLLPRLFGFELLMAPYVICHLKLALELGGLEGGFHMPSGQRLGVFLTNTLEEPHESTTGALFAHDIAREADSANEVKRDKPVMVMLGNPPYSGHSANKGAWIVDLIDTYKQGFPELKKPGQAKWLSDDYVKFIRFAQWRIERTGQGIVGFITNHAYLDNPTFRGMRHSLLETFDAIFVLNLHGNAKKKERAPDGGKDENVFDIQQGVAISLFVKHANNDKVPARVYHSGLWGQRQEESGGGKDVWLASNDVETTKWEELVPKPPRYLFVPRDETNAEEYENAWAIPEIFSQNGRPAPGIVTTHDQFAISWSPEEAAAKVERLLATQSEEAARRLWRLCTQDQWKYERAKQELADGSWKDQIQSILYRPFDMRTTVLNRNVAVHRRERVMRHLQSRSNLALSTTRSTEIATGWEHAFVARSPITHHSVSVKEVNYLFPLYVWPEGTPAEIESNRVPNLDPAFIKAVCEEIGIEYAAQSAGDLTEVFGPEDVFHYIYAVLHSPEYRQRYADFLKSDFPRIPLTGNRDLFASLVKLGQRAAALHLMEAEGANPPAFPHTGGNRVDKLRYAPPSSHEEPGRVWINRDQCFEGVATATWEFTIGGYRPAEKWLKDRKNRVLSYNDITHYRRICAALAETRQIMQRIDQEIDSHGGWPLQ